MTASRGVPLILLLFLVFSAIKPFVLARPPFGKSSESLEYPLRWSNHQEIAIDVQPPQRKLKDAPHKRYLGIEIPDFIAASNYLLNLKEKMRNSGKK